MGSTTPEEEKGAGGGAGEAGGLVPTVGAQGIMGLRDSTPHIFTIFSEMASDVYICSYLDSLQPCGLP